MNRPEKFSFSEGSFDLQPATTDIGMRILAFREKEGLSIGELADKLGLSRQAVWYWETGQRTPRQAALSKLTALGLRLAADGLESKPSGDTAAILREAKNRLAKDLGIKPEAIRILIEG